MQCNDSKWLIQMILVHLHANVFCSNNYFFIVTNHFIHHVSGKYSQTNVLIVIVILFPKTDGYAIKL